MLAILAMIANIIAIAAKALHFINYKDQDSANGTTIYDSQQGYIVFPLVACSISFIILTVKIIQAAMDKNISVAIDHMLFQKFMAFQLAVGTCMAV